MISGSQCWYFKSSKQTWPYPQKGLAPILIVPPHTYVRNPGNDYFCKTKQNQCYWPIEKKLSSLGARSLSFLLLEFSPVPGKLIWYLHGSYLIVTPCLHRTWASVYMSVCLSVCLIIKNSSLNCNNISQYDRFNCIFLSHKYSLDETFSKT